MEAGADGQYFSAVSLNNAVFLAGSERVGLAESPWETVSEWTTGRSILALAPTTTG